MMVKRRKIRKISKLTAERLLAQGQKAIETQEQQDKAFVQHIRSAVRNAPIGPNNVLMSMLFDALDRLHV